MSNAPPLSSLQLLRLLQQREHGRRDPHGLARGAGVEVGDFAAGAEQAELGLQLLDQPQRLLARRPQRTRDCRRAARSRIASPSRGRQG